MGVKFNPFTSKLDIVDSPSGEFSDIELALGTQTAPSLSFTGDPDTGIYSPGADQLAISTNGQGRLFVDASGNVGIGQAPTGDQEASIRNSGFTALLVGSNNALGAMLALDGDSNGDGAGGDYSYIYHNPSGALEILQNSPSGTNEIQFKTAGQLRATLNSTGLGLGTSSPSSVLHCANAGPLQATIQNTAASLTTFLTSGSSAGGTGTSTNHPFDVYTNNQFRLRVTSTGNVGIGTTSPATPLHVGLAGGIRFDQDSFVNHTLTSSSNNFVFTANAGAANRTCNFIFQGSFSGGASVSEAARIDSSGRLLVGTPSSTNVNTRAVFQGYGASANEYAIVCLKRGDDPPAAGSGLGLLSFGDKDADNVASIGAYRGTGTWTHDVSEPTRLVFSTTADGLSSPTERMRIASDGTITFNFTGAVYEAVTLSHTATYGNGTLQIQPVTFPGSGVSQFYTHFADQVGGGTTKHNVTIDGALSKGSGSFRIPHPLKPDTHNLVHSFIEGPQADLIYRGHVQLTNGTATVNIDEAGRMTEGTFEALCTNVCCFTSNESDWTAVRGSVSGNILTIEAQDPTSTAEICWMVVGERKDQHMIDTEWTDENGRVITEPMKNQAQ